MGFQVAVGGILTECNHFGGLPIDMAAYECEELLRGEALLGQTTSVVGGMLAGLRKANCVARPLLFASACSGGPIVADCYERLRAELLERLGQAGPLDGVLMPLHGAALAEGVDDPEGDLIHAVRAVVGDSTPIVVTLDLHAHVTHEMVQHADAILAWETYPHEDQFSTGERAAEMLCGILQGRFKPTMAMGKVPVITSAICGATSGDGPFADLMRQTKSLERQPGVLSTSLFLIHPYMDCADMGSGALVITNDDLPRARQLAGELAECYWQRRHDLEPATVAPPNAIRQGFQVEGGPVLLVETADCCGGGAAGDSIAALSALVDGAPNAPSIVPIVDPYAAAACFDGGLGSFQDDLPIGHKLDPRWGESRAFCGEVVGLYNGNFTYDGGMWNGMQTSMGRTAVFRIQSVLAVLMSRGTYDWAGEQLRAVELDPADSKFVVVKNPMNYRQAYGHLAKSTIILDTPGPTPATLKHVRFTKLKRPYFPADTEIAGLRPVILS